MARWIDANPAQRLHQYTLPAARKEVQEAPAMIEEFKRQIAAAWAYRAKQPLAAYERRAGTRRVRNLIDELRTYERQVAWSRDLIAKHGRRPA